MSHLVGFVPIAKGAVTVITRIVIPLTLIAAPYAVLGIAQTSRLHDAVQSGQIERVRAALKPWKSINARNRYGATPLMIAISGDHIEITEFLVTRGARIYGSRSAGNSTDHLIVAISYGRRKIAELLLTHAGPPLDGAALEMAIRQRVDFELTRLLLEHGAPTRSTQDRQIAPLHHVIDVPGTVPIERRIAIADLLLKHGADLLAIQGESPLMHRIFWRSQPDVKMAEFLLLRGYPVDMKDKHGRTALGVAAAMRSVDGVQLLLANGADPNMGAPIFAAIRYDADKRSIAILELLIKHKADVNTVDGVGHAPIMYAARARSFMTVKTLLDAGANPNLGPIFFKPLDASTTEEITQMLRQAGACSAKDRACLEKFRKTVRTTG